MKVQLIKYYFHKHDQQGFTKTQTLLMFLVGFLAFGITIPFVWVQRGCGCGSEARQNIGATNRAQQAYFLENNKFAQNFEEMEIGIKEQTEDYIYYTKIRANVAFNYAIARRSHISKGLFDQRPINSYVGAVFIIPHAKKDEQNTIAITCVNDKPGTIEPKKPFYKNGVLGCGEGTT